MSIACGGCGRIYGHERFVDGRTFRCTCGARVDGPPAARCLPADEEPSFLTDAMLGGLTRWLRMLGFDSAHRSQGADPQLIRQALAERRFVVTRDRRLALEWRVEGILLVRSDDTLAQLSEVDRQLALARFARPFTRCSRCNTVLVSVPVAEVAARVPRQVLAAGTDVSLCAGCGRVYWQGSHTERMRRLLAARLRRSATERG